MRTASAHVGAAGFSLLILGTAMVMTVAAQTSAGAQAVTGSYELYCPGSPVGNIVLNGVTTSGTLSPASPSSGQQFNLTGYQTVVDIPAAIAAAAAALGNTAITGSVVTSVDATGATPATTNVGPLDFTVTIPSPVPSAGVTLSVPSTAQTVGPFTATGNAVTIQEDVNAQLTLVVSGSQLALTCKAYPDNSLPTGIVNGGPSASPVAPVIAEAGGGSTITTSGPATTTTTPPSALTGPYELFCPGTPVGNVVLNDAVTSATLSPPSPSPGQSFSVTGYQTVVNLPNSLASAAAAVSPTLTGSATAQIDANGATPATTPEGPLDFNVPFPSPIPDAGVSLSLPSTPATVTGFTATTGAVTIEEDSSASLTLSVAGNNLSLTCTAYPNDSVTPSGITVSTPTASAIAPVIAVAAASPPTTGTTVVIPTTTSTSTSTTPTTSSPMTPMSPTTTPIVTTPAAGPTTTTGGAATTVAPTTAPTTTPTTTTSPGATTTKPPTTTSPTTTAVATTAVSAPTTAPAVSTASSSSLAFTGPGKGIKTFALFGLALILLGLLMLVLVDIPRRALRQLAHLGSAPWNIRIAGGTRAVANRVRTEAARSTRWLLGR